MSTAPKPKPIACSSIAWRQHHWLHCRAEFLESKCFSEDGTVHEKRLALYLRYRTSHERAFHKCLTELLKPRAERRKIEIGFESQKRVKEEHTRKQEKHQMAKERHTWDVSSQTNCGER